VGARVAMTHVEVGVGEAVGGGEGEGGGAPHGAHSQELCQGGLAEVDLVLVHLGAQSRQDDLVGLLSQTVLTGKGDICVVGGWW